MSTDKSAALAHYQAQAAMCEPSAICALIRRLNPSFEEFTSLIAALGSLAADFDRMPAVYGADVVSELLDQAHDAAEKMTHGGPSGYDAADVARDMDKEFRAFGGGA